MRLAPPPSAPRSPLRAHARTSRLGPEALGILVLAAACSEVGPLEGPGERPLYVQPPGLHLVSALIPARHTLQVENRGEAPVRVRWEAEGLEDCEAEAVGFCLLDPSREVRLEPGGSHPVEVRFAPAEAPFEVTAVLHFSCDVPGCAQTVPLFAGAASAIADWRLSPGQIDFDATRLTDATTREVLIENLGAAPLTVQAVRVELSSTFSVEAPTRPFAVGRGGSVALPVEFRPTEAGAAFGQLRVTDGEGLERVVPLFGLGLGVCNLDVRGGGQGLIGRHQFPWTHVVSIENRADDACPLEFALSFDPPVTTARIVGEARAVIDGGASVPVRVEFVGRCPGTATGSLSVAGPGVELEIPLWAQVPPDNPLVVPNQIRQPDLRVGCPSARTVQIYNVGGGDLVLDAATTNGGGLELSPTTLPQATAPGRALELTLTATPRVAGPFEGRVDLHMTQFGSPECGDVHELLSSIPFRGDAAPAGPCD